MCSQMHRLGQDLYTLYCEVVAVALCFFSANLDRKDMDRKSTEIQLSECSFRKKPSRRWCLLCYFTESLSKKTVACRPALYTSLFLGVVFPDGRKTTSLTTSSNENLLPMWRSRFVVSVPGLLRIFGRFFVCFKLPATMQLATSQCF